MISKISVLAKNEKKTQNQRCLGEQQNHQNESRVALN